MSSTSLGRLLIVDDEVELMSALKEMLAIHGYDTAGFTSGPEALEALKKESFDLLLTDLMMPEMDGLELLRAALEIDPRLVGIIMTGQGTISTAVEAMKSGAFDYVLKPFKLQMLLPILPRAMEMRRLRMDNLQLRETVAIYELAQAIAFRLDTSTILNKLADCVVQQLQADEVTILLPTPQGNELSVAVVRGAGRDHLLGGRIPLDRGIAGWVAKYRQPLTLNGPQAGHEPEPLQPRPDIVSAIIHPMLVGGKLIGLVNINLTAGRRAFTLGEVKTLSILVNTAAAALESASLLDEVRRREATIAESEERFRMFMNHNPAVAFMKDIDGRYVYINDLFERTFQITSAQCLGKFDFELFPDEVSLRLRADDQRVLNENRPLQVEEMVPLPDGSVRQWFVVKFPFPESSGRRFLGGLAVDITESKRAQERIREQAMLLDHARDAIFVCDLDGIIRYWNQGAERSYGYSAAQAVGQPAETLLFKRLPPDLVKVRAELMASGAWSGELQQQRSDGKDILVESRWTLVRDDQGQPKEVLIINTDITEKKQLESQYLRAQRMESVGTLAGGIAHDLNNVLTPITMAIELLRMRLKNTEHDTLLETLYTSAARGADMVKQVLSFARGVEGQRKPLLLPPLIKETVKLVKHTFPKNIEVQFTLPARLPTIMADATQIHQLLMNLCVNARDAMPEGGCLDIAGDHRILDEHYARMNPLAKAGPYVMLSVRDSGVGIAPENLERIFDPFFTTKEVGKGTGLGLATVQGIVKSHGGFLHVVSEPGRGAEFQIFLPALELVQAHAGDGPTTVLPRGSGELILVVDDEAAIRQITKHTLENYGYRVLTASDGSEALDLFARHRQDVRAVLTDLVMPIMDGPATIQALRRLEPRVRVLAASGWSSGITSADASTLQVDAFLTKPYTADQLLTALKGVLAVPPKN